MTARSSSPMTPASRQERNRLPLHCHDLSTISRPFPPSALASPSASPSPNKKSLQVTWHPSVNRHQSAKRNRQVISALVVLLSFSTLTLVLYCYSGCDLATGLCNYPSQNQQRKVLPTTERSRGRERLAIVDHDGFVTAAAAASTWDDTPANPSLSGFNFDNNPVSEVSGHPDDDDLALEEDDLDMDLEDLKQESTDSQDDQADAWDEYDDDDNDDDASTTTSPTFTVDEYLEFEEEDLEMVTPPNLQTQHQTDHGADHGTEFDDDDDPFQLPTPFSSLLDPGELYVTYLPYGGLAHQFSAMLRAIWLAKALDRTLVLPPMTRAHPDYSDSNDQNDHNPTPGGGHRRHMDLYQQKWSDYLDLSTFIDLTGVKVVEIPTPQYTSSMTRPLECQVHGGVGSLRPLDFTAKEYLKQSQLELVVKTWEGPSTKSRGGGLLRSTIPERTIEDIGEDEDDLEELVQLFKNSERESRLPLLCLTNIYKSEDPLKTDWDAFGRYMYFTQKLEDVFAHALAKLEAAQGSVLYRPGSHISSGAPPPPPPPSSFLQHFGNLRDPAAPQEGVATEDRDTLSNGQKEAAPSETTRRGPNHPSGWSESRHDPFISIHVRRGQDYIEYCQSNFQHDLSKCLPTTQELASRLHHLGMADSRLQGLPVYVSTDEDRPAELSEFRALGWQVLDHQALGSSGALGIFGAWMVDQVFMSEAYLLIGVQTNSFTRVGAYRQEVWNGKRAVLV